MSNEPDNEHTPIFDELLNDQSIEWDAADGSPPPGAAEAEEMEASRDSAESELVVENEDLHPATG